MGGRLHPSRLSPVGTRSATTSPEGGYFEMNRERPERHFGERTLTRTSKKRRGLSLSGRGYSERILTRLQRRWAGAVIRRAFFTGRYAKRDDLSRREGLFGADSHPTRRVSAVATRNAALPVGRGLRSRGRPRERPSRFFPFGSTQGF